MKAYFVLCILLASILFFPSLLLARELAAAGESGGSSTFRQGKPNPLTPGAGKPKSDPCKGDPYRRSCPGNPPKSGSCKYKRNCPPT